MEAEEVVGICGDGEVKTNFPLRFQLSDSFPKGLTSHCDFEMPPKLGYFLFARYFADIFLLNSQPTTHSFAPACELYSSSPHDFRSSTVIKIG
jgi:hypothetical protein